MVDEDDVSVSESGSIVVEPAPESGHRMPREASPRSPRAGSARMRPLALAVLGLVSACGPVVAGGSGRHQPAPEGELPPDVAPAAAQSTTAVVASAPPADAPAPQQGGKADESEADRSDYPDEPEDGQGQVRDLGRTKAGGGSCLLRVGPVDRSLDAVVLDWIRTREERAARDAVALCSSERPSGQVAAGFACRALKRRRNVLIVACYTFPNVMGNANPSRSHAVFDVTNGRPKLLGVGDMFVSKQAACRGVGVALAARGPQLHERSPAQWSERCRAASGTPVANDTISVVGPNLTFDVSYDFMAWGNAPDPVKIPVKDLRDALTPRFAALLEE